MSEADQTRLDTLTIGAIAVVVYAATNLLHEVIGHGGACLLVHGHPRSVTAIYFDSLTDSQPDWANRVIASGGTIANLIAMLLVLPLVRNNNGTRRFVAWLFVALNFLMPAGYLMFSGLGKFGDWAIVAEGQLPEPVWRIGEAVLGAILYFWLGPRFLLPWVEPFLGRGPDRVSRAKKLMLWPYLVGGVLFVVASLPNPAGLILVLVSGAAASFGGTSLLAWVWRSMGTPLPETPDVPMGIPRSKAWIVAGVICALLFICVLGPGVQLSPLRWPASPVP